MMPTSGPRDARAHASDSVCAAMAMAAALLLMSPTGTAAALPVQQCRCGSHDLAWTAPTACSEALIEEAVPALRLGTVGAAQPRSAWERAWRTLYVALLCCMPCRDAPT